MLEHDLVVSAAGTSVWELCCLGIPMALVCAVENQRRGYDRVLAHAAAEGLGIGGLDSQATERLAHLLDDPALRRSSADRAATLVDGRGASRIVNAWEQLVSEPPDQGFGTPPELKIRAAELADADQLLQWRNDAETRRFSRSTQIVTLAEHQEWLRRTVFEKARVLLIASDGFGDVGTVRWDRSGASSWEVSITVAPNRRGQSLGRSLLACGEQALLAHTAGPVIAIAAIRTDNAASRRLFTRSGYLRDSDPDHDGFSHYVKNLGAPRGDGTSPGTR
jgi:RimJ/RimL family protein N-acetyltransferase